MPPERWIMRGVAGRFVPGSEGREQVSAPYVVQRVEWFQFRSPDGKAFFVMTGSIDGLRSSLDAALEFLRGEGTLVGSSLVVRPHPDVLREMI